jgi:hypothetical protein
MTIMILHLITGEDVIGDVTPANGVLEVKNACTIGPRQDPNTGQVKIGLAPFNPYTEDKTIVIYPHAVVSDAVPAQEIVNSYNQVYGAGIQVVSSLAGL